jgi:hypothetical protein
MNENNSNHNRKEKYEWLHSAEILLWGILFETGEPFYGE